MKGIPEWAALPVAAAFLIEIPFYLLPGFEAPRAWLAETRKDSRGVPAHRQRGRALACLQLWQPAKAGLLHLSALLLLIALAVSFWYIVLPAAPRCGRIVPGCDRRHLPLENLRPDLSFADPEIIDFSAGASDADSNGGTGHPHIPRKCKGRISFPAEPRGMAHGASLFRSGAGRGRIRLLGAGTGAAAPHPLRTSCRRSEPFWYSVGGRAFRGVLLSRICCSSGWSAGPAAGSRALVAASYLEARILVFTASFRTGDGLSSRAFSVLFWGLRGGARAAFRPAW